MYHINIFVWAIMPNIQSKASDVKPAQQSLVSLVSLSPLLSSSHRRILRSATIVCGLQKHVKPA